MTNKSNPESRTINQWVALNAVLKTQRIISLSLGSGVALLSVLCLSMFFQNPTVVLVGDGEKDFVEGQRQEVVIEKSDIERFVRSFIHARYSWEAFNTQNILKSVRPYVVEGFYRKLANDLKKDKDRTIQGKSIKQVVADIKVDISEKDVVASFFKLLIVEGIPLPIVSQVSFQLAKGTATKGNPLGMYVNGIVEHESEGK